jgi:hypothetical protein
MKKSITLVSVVFATLILSAALFAQTNAGPSDDESLASLPDFQFMIGGNVGYVTGNSEIKNAAKDNAEWIADNYNTDPGYVLGGFMVDKTTKRPVAYGFELGMRKYFGKWGFGIDGGMNGLTYESEISSPNYPDKPTYSLTVISLQGLVTVYYRIIATERSFFALGAGAGFYYSQLSETFESNMAIPDSAAFEEGTYEDHAIGYHVKADYTYVLGPVGLTAGVMGRYVVFGEYNDFDYDSIKAGVDASFTGVFLYLAAGLAI